jgi:hypothetical protein
LPDVSHFIETKGVGTRQAISEIGRADTTQAELLAKLATPLLGAALARVYDSLAVRGYQVPGGGPLDIAAIANQVSGSAGAHITDDLYAGKYADLMMGAAPGNYTNTLAALFSKANPLFSTSQFGQILQQLPAIAPPPGVDIPAIQAQQQAFRAQRQAAMTQQAGTLASTYQTAPDPQAMMAVAPYVSGGLETLLAGPLAQTSGMGLESLLTQERGYQIPLLLTLAQQASMTPSDQNNPNFGMATGGWVNGGTPGRDSVPAMLEPGEFVVRRAVAEQMGPALEQLNGVRGYLAGGLVDPNDPSNLARGWRYPTVGEDWEDPAFAWMDALSHGRPVPGNAYAGGPPLGQKAYVTPQQAAYFPGTGQQFPYGGYRPLGTDAGYPLPFGADPNDPMNAVRAPLFNPSSGFSMSGIRSDRVTPVPVQAAGPAALHMPFRDTVTSNRVGSTGLGPITINITINGDVTNPKATAAALVLPLRDELNRVEARFSRVGNKKQG